jgi:DNA-binding response OmpR family regulator
MAVSYEKADQFEARKQSVSVSDMQWDAEQHTVVIGDTIVALTPAQYHLLSTLQHGLPVTYAALARVAYNCAIDKKVRMMMDKHIDRIRAKLQGTGVYIYCVLGYGYLLFGELLPEEEG